jgi:WD40 repeat protein
MSACPSPEALGQLLAGDLAGPAAGAVRAHLADCPACQARMDTLSEVPELRRLRAGARPAGAPTADTPPGLVERLLQATPPGPEEGPRPALPFLGPPEADGEAGTLGPYRLLCVLGRGGMGVVFKAHDRELGRTVAVKVLRAEGADGKARLRLVREARAAAAVEHENVVAVYSAASLGDGPLYLVMQYVAGQSLRERIRAGGPLPPREAARVCREAAAGLHALHQAGLVHRDVKPANILLDAAGGRAKVSDLGLVRALGQPEASTREGVVAGTPEYLSPEQVLQPDRIDARADVYGLGMVLYEALTGAPAFRGAPQAVLQQVLHDEPAPPRRLAPATPRDLETVCLKALAKEPARRYQTAREMGEDLGRWLDGRPVRARPVGRAERLWRWGRANPGLAGSSAVAAAALLAVALVSALLAVKEGRHAQALNAALRASEESGRRSEERRGWLERRLAEDDLDRGLALCEQGEVGRGLLWLARALKGMPADAADLRRAALLNFAAWSDGLGCRLEEVRPHSEPLDGVACGPDGKTVATASRGRSAVRIWGPAGELLRTLRAPQGVGLPFAYSPDGRALATSGGNGHVRVWDVCTGRPAGKELRHTSGAHALAFGPEGRTLLVGYADRTARLWKVDSGEELGHLTAESAVVAVAVSPDGKFYLTRSERGCAQLWKAEGLAPGGKPQLTVRNAAAAAFRDGGKEVVLAAEGRNPTVLFVETVTGKLRGGRSFYLAGAAGPVVFLADGKWALAGTGNRSARLWDTATGQPLGPCFLCSRVRNAVAAAPDGRTLLTASPDGGLHRWRLGADGAAGHVLRHPWHVQGVAYSPDGRAAVTACADGKARLWDAQTGEPRGAPLEHGKAWVSVVGFSPDGRTVLTAGEDGVARLWGAATGAPSAVLRHGGRIVPWNAAFSPDGRFILTGSDDRTARLWAAATGRPAGPPLRHKAAVAALAFSPDGRLALTAAGETAHLWKVPTGEPAGALEHPGGALAAAFSPDGRWAVTGGGDGTARLWDVGTGQALGRPMHHEAQVRAVACSPDGRFVLTGSTDHTARLWEAPTGKPVKGPLPHEDRVRDVAFSPDGRLLLTASFDGTARLWDAATGKAVGPPVRHTGWVVSAAFRPDGRAFLTGSSDGTARLCPVPAAVPDEVDRLTLWAEGLTGLRLDEDGVLHVLGAGDWQGGRRHLEELGGPPQTGLSEQRLAQRGADHVMPGRQHPSRPP